MNFECLFALFADFSTVFEMPIEIIKIAFKVHEKCSNILVFFNRLKTTIHEEQEPP